MGSVSGVLGAGNFRWAGEVCAWGRLGSALSAAQRSLHRASRVGDSCGWAGWSEFCPG